MKKIIIAIFLLVLIVIIGTLGYAFIENWSLFDSFYMTIITIGTVGFHEVAELSYKGRVFTTGLIMFGIGIGGYAIANLSAFIIEGEIQNILKGRKMEKEINKLKNHFIVCGYGKTGIEIINEFKTTKRKFVVIENDVQKIAELQDEAIIAIQGDATEDEILEKAGVENAEGLIASLPNDADNVYIVLTSRGMNPKLRIIARAIDSQSSRKLIRAGADNVVSPYSIAGKRMAKLLLSPGIVNFLDVMVQSSELELRIEEITLEKHSSLLGKNLSQSNIKAATDGAMVIGIKKSDGRMVVNPSGNVLLEGGSVLYVLGNSAQIENLKKLAG